IVGRTRRRYTSAPSRNAATLLGAAASRSMKGSSSRPPPRSSRYWSAIAAYRRICTGSIAEISSKNQPQEVYLSRRFFWSSRRRRASTRPAASSGARVLGEERVEPLLVPVEGDREVGVAGRPRVLETGGRTRLEER